MGGCANDASCACNNIKEDTMGTYLAIQYPSQFEKEMIRELFKGRTESWGWTVENRHLL